VVCKRIDWLDIAKGLTILLVIIGHSVGELLRDVIYSFHMPLFFVLSCVTYNLSTNDEEYMKNSEKAFSRLFLAAVGIYVFRTVISIIRDFTNILSFTFYEWKQYWANIINVFVGGSGLPITIGDTKIAAIGIPWFLMALFFGRTLFDYLHLKLSNKHFCISIALCSVIGVSIGRLQWLPFSFDIALAVQPLFMFGQWLKRYDMENKAVKTFIVSAVIWSALFGFLDFVIDSYLNLACRKYPSFPLCYACAIAGTMLVASFSQGVTKFKYLCKPIKYLGKNSLIMLWVHSFDHYYYFVYEVTEYDLVNAFIRVGVDLSVFALVMILIEHMRKYKMNEKPA